jgi:hypothetical protein
MKRVFRIFTHAKKIIFSLFLDIVFIIFQIKAYDASCNAYKPYLQMEDFKFKYVSQ